MHKCLAVCTAVTLMACSSAVRTVQYVARDTDPGSATITVVPVSRSVFDVAAADATAGWIVGSGCRVIERPSMIKEREDLFGSSATLGSAIVGSTGAVAFGRGTGEVSKTVSVDPVEVLKQTDADYAVFVRSLSTDDYWLRIVRRQTGQVLYSGLFSLQDTSQHPGSGCLPGLNVPRKPLQPAELMQKLLKMAGVIGNR